MSYEFIRYEVIEGVATLTFNRPEVLNAHHFAMKAEIQAAADEAAADPAVRVLVLTGAGRGFHAGEDINAVFLGEDLAKMQAERDRGALLAPHDQSWNQQVHPRYFYGYPKPTIAAVNGAAAGAGLSIALSCDIRIAAESARFGFLYTRRGLMGPGHGIQTLISLVGVSRALEMVMSGELVTADEAMRIGLVRSVVPDEKLRDAVQATAEKLMMGAPLAQQAIKQFVEAALFPPGTAADRNTMIEQALLLTEDHAEGARAFAERRNPTWVGR